MKDLAVFTPHACLLHGFLSVGNCTHSVTYISRIHIMKLITSFIFSAVLLAASFSPATVQAAVVIAGTRVVYPASEREVTINLTNKGATPLLVQSWLDEGDTKAKPENISVPFTLSPPMFRMNPAKGQTLRLLATPDAVEKLPKDKESVFWLNVMEIPPKPQGEAANENMMQLAFKTRIKVFYRPKGLKGTADEV